MNTTAHAFDDAERLPKPIPKSGRTLRERVMLRYLRRLLRSEKGRAHLLNQLADAEGNGENQVFERVLSRVEDPHLQRLIAKHQADEIRHEQLFLDLLARTGEPPRPVPAELKLIDRVDRAVGGLFSRPFLDDKSVMEAYCMLQVIEERAITQFAVFEQAFREVDPAAADVFLTIGRDEERHLRYCHAIARRYAPDERTLAETVERFRVAEARCFAENSAANLAYVFDRGIYQGGPIEKWLWRSLQWVTARRSRPPFTTYRTEVSSWA
jgi:rubrerythrin